MICGINQEDITALFTHDLRDGLLLLISTLIVIWLLFLIARLNNKGACAASMFAVGSFVGLIAGVEIEQVC